MSVSSCLYEENITVEIFFIFFLVYHFLFNYWTSHLFIYYLYYLSLCFMLLFSLNLSVSLWDHFKVMLINYCFVPSMFHFLFNYFFSFFICSFQKLSAKRTSFVFNCFFSCYLWIKYESLDLLFWIRLCRAWALSIGLSILCKTHLQWVTCST